MIGASPPPLPLRVLMTPFTVTPPPPTGPAAPVSVNSSLVTGTSNTSPAVRLKSNDAQRLVPAHWSENQLAGPQVPNAGLAAGRDRGQAAAQAPARSSHIGPLTGIRISGESERVFGQIACVAGADAERAGREESLRMGEIRDFSWKVGDCSPHVRVNCRYCKFATDFQVPK